MSCIKEAIIEEVRKQECLYNKKSAGYKNTIRKTRIWEEIGRKLGMSGEDCCKRWKTLRDKYTHECKKSDSPSGSGSSQHDQWSWELMPIMSFLSKFNQSKTTTSNLEEPGVSNETASQPQPSPSHSTILNISTSTDSSSSADLSPAPTAGSGTSVSKARRSNGNGDVHAAFRGATSLFKKSCTSKATTYVLTEDKNFGQAVALMLDSIKDDNLKRKTKAHILQHIANVVAQHVAHM